MRPRDSGFTLIEVLVAIAVITVVASSATTFFVGSLRVVQRQSQQQSAKQLALDVMESARTLRGAALLAGRSICTSSCPVPPTAAAAEVAGTQRWDAAAADGSSPALALPAPGQLLTMDGVEYQRQIYAGRCWQTRTGTSCGANTTDPLLFYRVVIAVSWRNSDCGGGRCTVVTTGLFSGDLSDPVFHS